MTFDLEGFLYQILSITLFSYLNSGERAIITLFQLLVLKLQKKGRTLKEVWVIIVRNFLTPGSETHVDSSMLTNPS